MAIGSVVVNVLVSFSDCPATGFSGDSAQDFGYIQWDRQEEALEHLNQLHVQGLHL